MISVGVVSVVLVALVVVAAGKSQGRPAVSAEPQPALGGRMRKTVHVWTTRYHGERQVVNFDWRWFDRHGGDLDGPDGADMAEAVQADSGRLLLRVYVQGHHAWRIAPKGGHLGDQVDGEAWLRTYFDPQDAMAGCARQLGLTSVERR